MSSTTTITAPIGVPATNGVKPQHFDVVIVGAGISGIDAAYRLKQKNPKITYAILEGRSALGGTWDLFRYPGIRSDSDMATLGFPFDPWQHEKMIADGADIRSYVEEVARRHGIDRNIRYGSKVVAAAWSTEDARWSLTCERADGTAIVTGSFLYVCTGYYDYERGHAPEWPGMRDFAGTMVYPQFWPADLDYTGKRVVVIGSGATAVTLVPAMADTAEHVTMLQRSPTYIVSLPSRDPLATSLRKRLPSRIADTLVRYKNIGISTVMYQLARRQPDRVKKMIRSGVLAALGSKYDKDLHDVDVHFNPSYKPWDQRLCLVPDGDLFKSLKSGRASIVTGTIETFEPHGIRLASGKTLPADIVVSATGLSMQLFSGVGVTVDGTSVDMSRRLVYKGTMMEGIPNFAFSFGYTNASWTLKVDLNARFVAKVVRHMRRKKRAIVTPQPRDPNVRRDPLLNLSSGYVQRAASILPQQGPMPWAIFGNYILDNIALRTARINDGTLRFARAKKKKAAR